MILDLFAGAGGWDQGLADRGVTDVLGLELDEHACATAEAAGHAREQVDIATVDPSDYDGIDGLIASPPCQDYSSAGRRGESGTADLTHLVLPWIRATRPEWVALEQVRGVLPIWQDVMRELWLNGYAAMCGLVDAADYGVPQRRVRAVLLASRTTNPEWIPTTHGGGLWGAPYVTLRGALGWDGQLDRRQQNGDGSMVPLVGPDRPSPTLTGSAVGSSTWRYRPAGGDWRPLTMAEAAIIQGFPPDYPWQGPRKAQGTQVGNAVPPPLAAALLDQFVTARAEAA